MAQKKTNLSARKSSNKQANSILEEAEADNKDANQTKICSQPQPNTLGLENGKQSALDSKMNETVSKSDPVENDQSQRDVSLITFNERNSQRGNQKIVQMNQTSPITRSGNSSAERKKKLAQANAKKQKNAFISPCKPLTDNQAAKKCMTKADNTN